MAKAHELVLFHFWRMFSGSLTEGRLRPRRPPDGRCGWMLETGRAALRCRGRSGGGSWTAGVFVLQVRRPLESEIPEGRDPFLWARYLE